jgi:hypothetical protein
VNAINKPANTRCPAQRHTGCAIYHKPDAGFPNECAIWSCRWLVNEAGETSRPDRLHIVIDVMPDFVIAVEQDGTERKVEVVQCWIDPRYPDAHQDKAFRDFVETQAMEGKICLLRFGSHDAKTLFAPCQTPDGTFYLRDSQMTSSPTHSPREILEALTEISRKF